MADRGYIELSIYKERPQRIKLENTFKSTKHVNSSVNGKKVCIWENPIEKINSERKFYTAEFQDIDGKGTGAYFTADSEKAFTLASEEIEFRNAAEKMIYDREKTEIETHEQEGFSIVARYHREPKEQDGKKYNISCEYFIKGTGSEKWYMLLEKRDGRIVEVGETLIVPI